MKPEYVFKTFSWVFNGKYEDMTVLVCYGKDWTYMKSTVLRFDKAGTTENSLSLHDDLQVFIKGLMCNDM